LERNIVTPFIVSPRLKPRAMVGNIKELKYVMYLSFMTRRKKAASFEAALLFLECNFL